MVFYVSYSRHDGYGGSTLMTIRCMENNRQRNLHSFTDPAVGTIE